MSERELIAQLIETSRKAQQAFESYSQDQVDAMVRALAKTVYDNAEQLARMAVDETRMGLYEDKVLKNRGKAKVIWNNLKDKRSVGIIDYDEKKKVYYVAKPKGVIGLVTPTTNPIVTPMCNAMFALKGRNSVIIAPHPRAKECGAYTVDLFNKELKKLGAPENLIQTIKEPSIELTQELMRQVDVVVATGGMAMVRSAYSSGKPAFGVGQGNVQVIIDRGVDLRLAAERIIAGRIFDNGIICSGEQSVIAPEDSYDETIAAFKEKGAWYIDDQADADKFRKILFNDKGVISRDVVGQTVPALAAMTGLSAPPGAKVILIKANAAGAADALCREKMCPVLAAFSYKTIDEAILIAKTNLLLEGAGHTASIHSNNIENIKKAGEALPISRLVVNQPSSTTAGGSFYNGFAPTTTLGCGSWGNNSISENLDYHHLINISRIGLYNEDAKVPTDEEIWS